MEFAVVSSAKVLDTRVAQEGADAEHNAILDDVRLIVEADRCGWKYMWAAEHHFLTTYSHLSASEVLLGYVAALTSRIHIGSGIFNLNPIVNHPVRVAERVAMLDHLSDGRFEFGTGRGAGSLEVTGFGLPDAGDTTRAAWDEVIREFLPMWERTDYSHQSPLFQVPHPEAAVASRNVLPKVWRKPHPPLWVACGNSPTYEKAARLGLGALGFSLGSPHANADNIATYKRLIGDAEPVGHFVNDNVMVVSNVICLEDGQRARQVAAEAAADRAQVGALASVYHDTFSRVGQAPRPPIADGHTTTIEEIDESIKAGTMVCGDPNEVVDQLQAFADIGIDQIGFIMPLGVPMDLALETVRLIGEHVIPKLDPDPEHRTSRMRAGTW